jgi:transposase
MGQVHIITGAERRRRWSEEQKRTIVAAAFAPGAVVAEVARRADINASLIYRWQKELQAGCSGFAEVVVEAAAPAAGPAPAVEVAVGPDIRLRLPLSTPPDLAAALVGALVRR